MRALLLIVTTVLLTTVGILYARQSNQFPEFFALIMPANTNQTTPPIDPNSKLISLKGNPCITPRNDAAEHGEVFLSFKSAEATLADGGCLSTSTVCNNGTRSADQEPYEFATCTVQTPRTCEVNGFIFPHDTIQTFYKLTSAGTCVSQERSCTDGEVDWDETYTYISCPSNCPQVVWEKLEIIPQDDTTVLQDDQEQPGQVATSPTPTISSNTVQVTNSTTSLGSLSQPNCPSPTGWSRREPWQQGSVFAVDSAPYGTTCEKIPVVCMYGSIRHGTKDKPGNPVTTQTSTTCSVADPLDCSTDCGKVNHSSKISTYQQAILPHGNGQTCDDVRITSSCSNGMLTPKPWTACSCQIAPPAACDAPNGTKITHGGSLTLYKEQVVEASLGDGSDICFRQRRQCVNGVRYDQSSNPNSFTYKYETCTIQPPSSTIITPKATKTTPPTTTTGIAEIETGTVATGATTTGAVVSSINW